MLKFLCGCILFLASCSSPLSTTNPTPPPPPIIAVTGDRPARIATVSATISKVRALPSAILDAQAVEEKIGDGDLGPSDWRSFSVVVVAHQDVDKWRKLLIPIATKPTYTQPNRRDDWWIDRVNFDSLQFYEPVTLTNRNNGWIGISSKTGQIYLFTFTM
jgi:hypothetical protein